MEPNIYFKNIDYDYTEKDISQIFSYIGNIKSLYIVRDSKGRSRGFGFMSYFTLEHAQRAVEEINGKFLGRKPVIVMFHIRKEERRMMKSAAENMGDISSSYYHGEPPKPDPTWFNYGGASGAHNGENPFLHGDLKPKGLVSAGHVDPKRFRAIEDGNKPGYGPRLDSALANRPGSLSATDIDAHIASFSISRQYHGPQAHGVGGGAGGSLAGNGSFRNLDFGGPDRHLQSSSLGLATGPGRQNFSDRDRQAHERQAMLLRLATDRQAFERQAYDRQQQLPQQPYDRAVMERQAFERERLLNERKALERQAFERQLLVERQLAMEHSQGPMGQQLHSPHEEGPPLENGYHRPPHANGYMQHHGPEMAPPGSGQVQRQGQGLHPTEEFDDYFHGQSQLSFDQRDGDRMPKNTAQIPQQFPNEMFEDNLSRSRSRSDLHSSTDSLPVLNGGDYLENGLLPQRGRSRSDLNGSPSGSTTTASTATGSPTGANGGSVAMAAASSPGLSPGLKYTAKTFVPGTGAGGLPFGSNPEVSRSFEDNPFELSFSSNVHSTAPLDLIGGGGVGGGAIGSVGLSSIPSGDDLAASKHGSSDNDSELSELTFGNGKRVGIAGTYGGFDGGSSRRGFLLEGEELERPPHSMVLGENDTLDHPGGFFSENFAGESRNGMGSPSSVVSRASAPSMQQHLEVDVDPLKLMILKDKSKEMLRCHIDAIAERMAHILVRSDTTLISPLLTTESEQLAPHTIVELAIQAIRDMK